MKQLKKIFFLLCFFAVTTNSFAKKVEEKEQTTEQTETKEQSQDVKNEGSTCVGGMGG